MKNNKGKKRLVIVSNRLPVVLTENKDGGWSIAPGSGGLVTALAPVLKDRGGVWIGWPGVEIGNDEELEALLESTTGNQGYTFSPVSLTREDVEGYYYGFANQILWPLFHDLQTRCNFSPAYWRAYLRVNAKFAGKVADYINDDDDYIWVHDYHLMCLGRELRNIGVHSKIGYFLHTPFPPLDLFLKLPWRFQILENLLAYDVLGFQTQRDRRNFVQCVHAMFSDVRIKGRSRILSTTINDRRIKIGNFPISIDYDEFAQKATDRDVKKRLAELQSIYQTQHLVLGIDRLDYSKGIPERLLAFRKALEMYPDLRNNISLIQVVVPSRENIPEYNDLKNEIERLISEINGEFTQPGWVPIHYIYHSIDRTELVALYLAADIALITPLKDGMNLIAKEYCASNINEDGVLILSEFAGAAGQLEKHALLVNPYDIESTAEKIYQAFCMAPAERAFRMRSMRKSIKQMDIYWWVDNFLKAVFMNDDKGFLPLRDYIPTAALLSV
jgi:trehalose 6-phosphate synthase